MFSRSLLNQTKLTTVFGDKNDRRLLTTYPDETKSHSLRH